MTAPNSTPPRIPDPLVQPTMTVMEAGSFLNLAKVTAYQAVYRGEIPTIRVGRRILVPTAALRRMLHIDAETAPPADTKSAARPRKPAISRRGPASARPSCAASSSASSRTDTPFR